MHRRLAPVYLTVFLDLLGFGLILPALPFYAAAFGGGGFGVGALLTAYSLAQFVGAPILGRLSDRHGRRPVLLVALAGSALSFLLTGLASSYALLLAGRTLAGLFGGSISTAQACIADVTSREERTKYMGLLGACIGLGFVFGPALGAAMSGFGFSAAAYVAAGLAAANFVLAWRVLPETRRFGSVPVTAPRRWLPVGELAAAVRRPGLGALLAAAFLVMFAVVSMETTYALLGEQLFGLTTRGMGLVFTFVGVAMVVVQGGLAGRLQKRFGDRPLLVVGALALAVSLVALPHLATFPASLAALGVLAVGQGLANPSLASLVSKSSGDDEQGSMLGLSQSLSAAARASGPVVAGALFDAGPGWAYGLAAAGALVTALLLGVRPPMVVPATARA